MRRYGVPVTASVVFISFMVHLLFKMVVEKMGKISGLVNCAGISTTLPINLVKRDSLDNFFQTNVYSAYFLTKECSKKSVIAENGLSVIFISSVMGVVGENGKSLYSMTKGALVAGVKSLACELAKKFSTEKSYSFINAVIASITK